MRVGIAPLPRFPLPAFVPAVYIAGLNYKTHAMEVNLPEPIFPVFAMKPTSSLLYPTAVEPPPGCPAIPHGTAVRVPKKLQVPADVDYEGELAVVIGETCRDVPNDPAAAEKVIEGFTIGLDMTARRWQGKKGGQQWCYAKSFDTFCPLGPDVVKIPLADLPSKRIVTRVNSVVVQDDTFSSFIFHVPRMIAFLSEGITLHKGTVILTGTPAGVGYVRKPYPFYLRDSDRVSVRIDDIGELAVTIEYEP
jgi:2-keto-4-pentenoate hydratase/2-oxohepta-3-ene-1,7-dioic acid hydratase in catechol pathway